MFLVPKPSLNYQLSYKQIALKSEHSFGSYSYMRPQTNIQTDKQTDTLRPFLKLITPSF